MKLKNLFYVVSLVLLIWICLPENVPVNFKVQKQEIKFTINPLKIDTRFFGIPVKKEFTTKLGLDLKGGSHIVFEADTSKVKAEDLQDSLASARDVIERAREIFRSIRAGGSTLKSGIPTASASICRAWKRGAGGGAYRTDRSHLRFIRGRAAGSQNRIDRIGA
jgi:preprotein translocase subunit SecD